VPLRRRVPLPRGLPPIRRTPVRKKRTLARRGPDRSPEYLAWIRTLGCVVCSSVSEGLTVVEAAHTNVLGARGMGQKTSDFSAVPLCAGHHRECSDSYHRLGEQYFAQEHQLDLSCLVAALNRLYRRLNSVRAVQAVKPQARLGKERAPGNGRSATRT
jgi:hypothetical protein